MQTAFANESLFTGPSSSVFLVRPKKQYRNAALYFLVLSIGAVLLACFGTRSSTESLSATKAASLCCGQCGQTFSVGDPKENSGVLRCCDACAHRYFPGLWWDSVQQKFRSDPPPPSSLYSSPSYFLPGNG